MVTTARRSTTARPFLSVVQDAALVVLCAVTAWAHVGQLIEGHITSGGFFLEQVLLIGMVIFRRRSAGTSQRLGDWLVAALGGWLPLAMRPADPASVGIQSMGAVVQLVGLSLTLVGFAYLGRSFGVVAANRGVKVNGPYRFIRHPVYFSHTVTLGGFVIANPSTFNACLFVAVTVFQLLRIRAEERFLSSFEDYALYMQRVRWRLLPGLY